MNAMHRHYTIKLDSRMVPKRSRCTVDMLNDIFSDKTIDVGKQCSIAISSPDMK
jgi:hypothetical protein